MIICLFEGGSLDNFHPGWVSSFFYLNQNLQNFGSPYQPMEVLKLNGLSKANSQDYYTSPLECNKDYGTWPLECNKDYCTTVRNNPYCAPEELVSVQRNFMVMFFDNVLIFNTSIGLQGLPFGCKIETG
jgi:hypothetical protein